MELFEIRSVIVVAILGTVFSCASGSPESPHPQSDIADSASTSARELQTESKAPEFDWTIHPVSDNETGYFQRGSAPFAKSVSNQINNAVRDATKKLEDRLVVVVRGVLTQVVASRVRGSVYPVTQDRLDESVPREYSRANLGFSSDSGRISPVIDGADTIVASAASSVTQIDSRTIEDTLYVLIHLELGALVDSFEGYASAYIESRRGNAAGLRDEIERLLKARISPPMLGVTAELETAAEESASTGE